MDPLATSDEVHEEERRPSNVAAASLARAAGAAVWWRALGVVGGKGIALLRSLLVARLLAPTDYGLFAIALVPLDLLLGVTDVGLTPALVQRADVTEHQYHVAWTAGLVRAVAVALLIVVAAGPLGALFGDPRAVPLIRALALRPLITALASARVAALERELRHRELALMEVTAALATTAVALALAATRGAWALVLGNVVGAAVGTLASYLAARYRPRLTFDRAQVASLIQFGRWILVSAIIGMVGESLLRVAISRALGTDALGRFTLALSLAMAPSLLVGGSVSAVAFAVHARVQDDPAQGGRVFRVTVVTLAAILLPVYAVLVVVVPSLVDHVLGPRWLGTAEVVQILALMGVLGIAFDAAAPLLQGRGQPRALATLYGLFAVGAVALTEPLARTLGLEGAALARVIAELAVLVGAVTLVRRAVDRPFDATLAPLAASTTSAACGAIVAHAIVLSRGTLPWLVGASAAGVGTAALALWAVDRFARLGLVAGLRVLRPGGQASAG